MGCDIAVDARMMAQLWGQGLMGNVLLPMLALRRLNPSAPSERCFFTAGFGGRLAHITLNTPKPMIRVHGKRIIQRL